MPSRLTVVLVSLLLALPVVIFWLWLVILPASVAILCPEGCRCDREGYNVICDDTTLNDVPLIHLPDVRELWFIEDNITLLQKDNFVSLPELEKLNLLRCGLRTIELGAFNGLTKLIRLSIWYNDICEIIPGTFQNITSLVYLNLQGNRIEYVDRHMFSGLFKLTFINLSGNKLQYLYPDTSLMLPNLQQLYLDNNPGLRIPTDRNFINSHSLSYLYISNCNISLVSVETFANVSALKGIRLSNNILRTVDINILRALPNLSTLQLYRNRLQCDCQLKEVWQWCKDRNIWAGDVICDTPSEVKGIGWGLLENGQCLEGNIQYYGDYNNQTYNYTESNDEYNINLLKQYEVPIYAVPFIIGTTGNVILLIIIICNKDMGTVPNMYIINLVVSDIIYLTVLFFEAYANRISELWLYDDFTCRFLPFCRRVSVCLSAYSVALLSIKRYRVIVNAFYVRVSSKPTWRGTVATIFGVWIVAALFAVPSAVSSYQCVRDARMTPTRYYQRVVIFELLASCVLPVCVIAFTYIMTARHLVKSSRSISEGTENPQMNKGRNTAKMVVGLTVVFLISYVPYHVFLTYIIWTRDIDEVYSSVRVMIFDLNYGTQNLISTCFLLINSCLNPVALFCTSSPIRQHLKRSLTSFYKTNSSSTDL